MRRKTRASDFVYDEETGKLFRWMNINRKNNTKPYLRECNSLSSWGYYKVDVNGKQLRLHRLIWRLVYGVWPTFDIDHIDGNRLNNRLDNLRPVTVQENNCNQKLNANSSSGVTGVNKHRDHWKAAIKVNGVNIHLGVFRDIESAKKVREKANEYYGFHKNHGRST